VKDKIRRSNWEKEVKLRITEGDKKREVISQPEHQKPKPKKRDSRWRLIGRKASQDVRKIGID